MKKTPVPPEAAPLAPGLRRYLYFTATMTGAAVMIVEILGAKMLAPYLGASHFVWTAQIAITLVALAAGYYAGGRLVDRSPRLGRLYWGILGASGYLGFTVSVVERVAYWCLDFKLAVGSLLASAFLFFVPLALLAMAGPFLVRLLTVSVDGVGGNVGRLTAISTLGSFVGTILIGYVLVPFLPNSVTLFATSGALIAVAAGYFFGWGRSQTPAAPVILTMLLGLFLGGFGVAQDRPAQGRGWREIYRANSNFGRLQIIDAQNGAVRCLLNDYLPQNVYDPAAKQSVSAFTYLLHGLARGYAARTEDVLCIGLGVGSVPGQFARDGARVEVVEINPAVAPLAKKFFDLDATQLNLVTDDGRHFVNRCAKKYDAIILDAFLGDSSPTHLVSREAFTAMQGILQPGGVLVINAFGGTEAGKDFFVASLGKTLQAVFRTVRVHAASDNIFFVASDQPEMRLRNPPELATVHPACRQEVSEAYANIVKTDPNHGMVLTDDYNPVEYFDAANREVVRRQLALAMRRR